MQKLIFTLGLLLAMLSTEAIAASSTKKKSKPKTDRTALAWDICRQSVKKSHGSVYKVVKVDIKSNGSVMCWYSH